MNGTIMINEGVKESRLKDAQPEIRSMSIKGCEEIGAGRSSHVYRINRDTIVKLYEPNVKLEKIHQEMNLARSCFMKGVSTAIPFELVIVGDSYGIVFEMIEGDTVGRYLSAHPEEFTEVTLYFSSFLQKIHEIKLEKDGIFKSVKQTWIDWLERMKDYYTPEEIEFMRKMIEAVPERNTMVHCDYHENNVLYKNGELILIDMADVGFGHPIFDLACMAFRSHVSFIPGRNAHHAFGPEDMKRFYEAELRNYFNVNSEEKFREVCDMCDAFGYLRSALFPMKHPHVSSELKALHISDARKYLLCRKDWALKQAEKLNFVFI